MTVKNAGGRLTTDAEAFRRLLEPRVWLEAPLRRKEVDVYWRPPTFAENLYPRGYNVYRGVVPQIDKMTKLNTLPVLGAFYFDYTVNVETGGVQEVFYAVTQIAGDGSEQLISDPVTLFSRVNGAGKHHRNISLPRIAYEFRRRKHIILDNDGERVAILYKRSSGERCSCYNGTYGQSKTADCPFCYGTTWQGGYDVVDDVILRILAISEFLQLQPEGLMLKTNPKAWLVDYPMLRDGDIVVRANNFRYEINGGEVLTLQGILTEQTCELIRLDNTHPVYNFTS